jgi:hypothetical protein
MRRRDALDVGRAVAGPVSDRGIAASLSRHRNKESRAGAALRRYASSCCSTVFPGIMTDLLAGLTAIERDSSP